MRAGGPSETVVPARALLLVGAPFEIQHEDQAAMHPWLIWRKRERTTERRDGLGDAPQVLQDDAQMIERVGIVGAESQGALVQGNRVLKLPEALEAVAQPDQRRRRRRPERQCPLEGVGRLLVAIEAPQRVPEVRPAVRIFGRDGHGPGQEVGRLLPTTLGDQDAAEVVHRAREVAGEWRGRVAGWLRPPAAARA